jgi:purine-nucleoside phosphorylase
MSKLKQDLEESCAFLEQYKGKAKNAVIFGTGLAGATLDKLKIHRRVSYSDIPNFPSGKNDFHKGELIAADLNGSPLMVMTGRVHCYEGYTVQQVVYPIHVLKELGVECLVNTSSVGGVNKNLSKGDLMVLRDHINLTSLNPLIGYDDSLGTRFLPGNFYDSKLASLAEKSAASEGISLKNGILFFLPGPSFETIAEFKSIEKLGGDTIGWSGVLETIVANYRNMKVLGINCITDSLNFSNTPHLKEISNVAEKSSHNLYKILAKVINLN